MRRLLQLLTVLFATAIALAQPAPAKPAADLWAPLQFLLGDWVGEGNGAPGQSAGGFSFQPDLQRQILVRKSRAEYPATKDRPAFAHDDLTIVYPQPEPAGSAPSTSTTRDTSSTTPWKSPAIGARCSS